MRDYIYIDDLYSRGDFDDWYNATMKQQHCNNKTFEELDDEDKLWVCHWFEKDYLERD